MTELYKGEDMKLPPFSFHFSPFAGQQIAYELKQLAGRKASHIAPVFSGNHSHFPLALCWKDGVSTGFERVNFQRSGDADGLCF